MPDINPEHVKAMVDAVRELSPQYHAEELMWFQKRILLQARNARFHLVTHEIVSQLPELERIEIGLAHIFLQHTSASLAINENADADVRYDLEGYFSRIVPENERTIGIRWKVATICRHISKLS